jgi:hypothetical protein
MKRTGILISLFLLAFVAQSQVTGSFTVNGNINTYYMVSFNDPGFSLNAATDLTIGRSNISQDASWRGAIIAKFRYHVTNWGHGANFINAEIAENPGGVIPTFVGGWQDVTIWSGADSIVIWLRGGGTTYYYSSPNTVSPVVYDGTTSAGANHSSFTTYTYPTASGNITLSTKATPDTYVNQNGTSLTGSIYSTGASNNYFAGNVGIGTSSPNAKLAIAASNSSALSITGNSSSYIGSDIAISRSSAAGGVGQSPAIQFNDGSNTSGSWIMQGSNANGLQFFSLVAAGWYEKMRLTQEGNLLINKSSQANSGYKLDVAGDVRVNKLVVNTTGADFVFEPKYKLTPLDKVEEYIQTNHHLEGIAAATQMQKDGVELGENQTKLLQKVEELTLYIISQNKLIEAQRKALKQQQDLLEKLQVDVKSMKEKK